MGLYDEHGLVNMKCDRCNHPQMVMCHPHDISRKAMYQCPECGYSIGGGYLGKS